MRLIINDPFCRARSRYQLKFAEDKGPNSYSTWSKARNIGNAVRRASIARTSMITATDTLPGLSLESDADVATEKGEPASRAFDSLAIFSD